jgi:hypothetical protein
VEDIIKKPCINMKPQKLALVLSFLLSSPAAAAAYYTVLQESYTPANFFSKFNFYSVCMPFPNPIPTSSTNIPPPGLRPNQWLRPIHRPSLCHSQGHDPHRLQQHLHRRRQQHIQRLFRTSQRASRIHRPFPAGTNNPRPFAHACWLRNMARLLDARRQLAQVPPPPPPSLLQPTNIGVVMEKSTSSKASMTTP